MRIFFAGGGTGGHLYPGLAIARALVRLDPTVRPFFVGAHRGIERTVLPDAGFPFELLDLHPLYRSRVWENWRTARGLASAWRGIGRLAAAERPRMVVGTGGYAAGAVLAWAAAHGVPLALQEQNSVAGLTVRGFSRWARAVYLGFPEAAATLHANGRRVAMDTGNPIEPPPTPRPDRAAARARWGFPERGGLVLLVFGGSQGARPINAAVAAWIARGLPEGVHVIWGTGRAQYDAHAGHESARVRVRPYLAPIADAYAASDLALVRAGAMTTAELCAWGVPMVLVPLPTAAADHQTANARALDAAGAAVHLPQGQLDGSRLDDLVRQLAADPARLDALARAAASRARPDAAAMIARHLLTLAGSRAPG
ncbi:MAG TPA: UDP-N-acetylglucosamine--N-acetylmuramyl-(pentapeptide) pyrophosphoryl-undecaprenol N-acetylglucosamine transferase [Gemmatimonadaceae bacterium]|nr:UDP-N-acetylglucosamine--N-acetylmuramyl-(pentapeptide) pyrophosphoryl-undecaprenol N-acetylglucosamine transferase [Gemmatimonadaceae bacterium]